MSQASDQSVRVLVTGFGPFPGIPHNASASLTLALENWPAAPGLEVATAIIPVVWDSARAATRQAVARFRPHAVLHFGVSRQASGFEIETRALNMSGPKEDHAGVVRPDKPLVHAGKPFLMSTLPPHDLVGALTKDGLPAALSEDAGRYLCNALFYWSLYDSETDGRLVSFVHMPALGAVPGVEPRLTMEEAVAGARILVRASAEAVLRAKRNGQSQRGESIGHGSETLHRNERRGDGAARGGCG
jgi:pyroglutamyl-peptidase